jgi:predicted nuclease of predicted toxin-antitoxin system
VARYLVDANLPQTFNLWKPDVFLYANSLGEGISDNYIWDYAKQHSLTILSGDKDFADRMIHSVPPPKVIHFKIGNMRFADFRKFVSQHWEKIAFYNLNYKLVLVYPHSIEGIR